MTPSHNEALELAEDLATRLDTFLNVGLEYRHEAFEVFEIWAIAMASRPEFRAGAFDADLPGAHRVLSHPDLQGLLEQCGFEVNQTLIETVRLPSPDLLVPMETHSLTARMIAGTLGYMAYANMYLNDTPDLPFLETMELYPHQELVGMVWARHLAVLISPHCSMENAELWPFASTRLFYRRLMRLGR